MFWQYNFLGDDGIVWLSMVYNIFYSIQMSKKPSKKVTIGEDQRQKQQLIQMKRLDTTGLKEEIYQLREQLTYLIKKKSSIQSETIKSNEKYMKESFQIEKTTKIQEEQLTDLENNYKLLRNTFEETRKKHKNEWENELQAYAKKKSVQKQNMNKLINQTIKKIDYIKQFRSREIEYLSVLQRLKEREDSNKTHQLKDIDKIINEHESKRKDIRENVTKEIENIKQQQVNKLEQKMNKQQHIKRQNQLILEQINLCLSEKQILQRQNKELLQNDNNRTTNIDSLLNEQANDTYQRSLRVIKLQNKYNKLRQFLTSQIARLDVQIKNIEKDSEQTKKDLQQRIVKMQAWLKLKQKDIKKMKACSQMVLNQRSHLESYLLELDYKDSNNINQILRFLFIKINSKKPPVTYRDYLLSTQTSQISSKKSVPQQ